MPSFVDRYRAAGLERNPFAALQASDQAPSSFVSRGLPAPPPPGSKTLVQVIGRSGYGKTTHVQHWRTRTPGPYHYIPRRPYADRWHEPPIDDIVYGDEIDRMPTFHRRRWFQQLATAQSTVVIGTHLNLDRVAARSGLHVITHRLGPADRTVLGKMIDLRLDSVALSDVPTPRFTSDELDLVWTESGGVPAEADVICHRMLAERVW
jgi:hypothetical protein